MGACVYWIGVFVFFLLDKYQEEELLDYVATLFLIFGGISVLFCIVAEVIYNPTNNVQGFPFLHILLAVLICWFIHDSHPHSCKVVPRYCFNLHLPKDWWCWASFLISVVHCMSSLEKCLFRSSVHFSIRLLGFLWCYVVWVLYIVRILTLWPDVSFVNVLFHLLSCFFILSMVSFTVQNIFSMVKPHLFIYLFLFLLPKETYPKSYIMLRVMSKFTKTLLPVFSSRSFLFVQLFAL